MLRFLLFKHRHALYYGNWYQFNVHPKNSTWLFNYQYDNISIDQNNSYLSIIVSYNKYYYSKKHNGREWDRTTDLVINSHTRYLLRHSTLREVSLHLLRRTFNLFLNALKLSFCVKKEATNFLCYYIV